MDELGGSSLFLPAPSKSALALRSALTSFTQVKAQWHWHLLTRRPGPDALVRTVYVLTPITRATFGLGRIYLETYKWAKLALGIIIDSAWQVDWF